MQRSRPERVDLDLESVARLCVRHPGSNLPDLLSRAATRGRLSAADLAGLAGGAARDPAIPLPRRLDPVALGWFALVTAARVGEGTSTLQEVCDQLLLAHRASGSRGLAPRFRDLWLDALFLSGRAAALPYPREAGDPGGAAWRVRVDELNPYLRPGSAAAEPTGFEPWLDAFSEIFTRDGQSPVRLAPGQSPPLHRLVCDVPARRVPAEAPLVSVVVPVHDPGEDLRMSLASLLDQTWTRLEVLLCDDGSGPAGRALLEELAATDPRVRVLRHDTNQGAYAARNLGLAAAAGEFVTFQDADDWSHPDRVRLQVEPLLRDASVLATTSRMVRVDDRLGLTVLGYPAESVNASSLLFRREQVLERLGGFDMVRRAADNEFVGRLRAVFGDQSLRTLPVVLSLVQRTAGSLSRDDMRLLFRHPAREHYRFCYREWHSCLRDGKDDPFVAPPARPPVPARPRVSGGPPVEEHRADVVLLGGFSPGTPTTPDLATEIRSLRRAGRLALVGLPSPVDLSVPFRSPPKEVAGLVRTDEVGWVLPDERVTASLAVVRDPAAVEWTGGLLAGVRARMVLIVAAEAPSGRYDPTQVEHTVRTTVGGRAPLLRWLPATPSVARALAARVPSAHVLPHRLWGAVPTPRPARWDRTPRPVLEVLPVSSRVRPAELLAWASDALPQDPEVRVVSAAGAARLARRLGRPVEDVRGGRSSPEGGGRSASYVVLPPVPGRGPHLHPGVAAALLRGAVPILDPPYRELLGEAALYTDDRTPDQWLELHRADPGLYAVQQDRGADLLRTALGEDVLAGTATQALGTAARAVGPRRWTTAWPGRELVLSLRRGARAAARRPRRPDARS